ERLVLDLIGRLRVEQARDDHVQVPLQESVHEQAAGVDLDMDESARVTLFQRCYRGWDEIRAGFDDGADGGLAGASSLQRRELFAREPDLRQRRPGMANEDLSVAGGRDTAGMAGDELDVESLIALAP